MKLNSIISRYIFRELVPPFFLNTVFFSFVFLLARILEITNWIVNYKIGLTAVLMIILYTMPYFLVYVVPMSVMITSLLTFMRLSSDNEIDAMKAGGVSLYGILPPVLLFCVAGCAITGFMTIHGLPWGRQSLKNLLVEVAASNLNLGLKERTFNDSFKNVMLYISEIDLKKNELRDIFVEDRRNEKLVISIVAPRGWMTIDKESSAFQMKLFNGNVNQVDLKNRTVNNIKFDTYEVVLDLEKAIETARKRRKDEKEMYIGELREFIDSAPEKDEAYWEALIEFHRKFSIPFACITFGILAVPLGVRSKSARRSFGFGLAIAAFLLYYVLHAAGMVFGEAGKFPPVAGMWLPNIVMGGIGIFFLVRTAHDRPVGVVFLVEAINRLKSKFFHTVSKDDFSV